MLACEEVNDAEVAAGGRGLVPRPPENLDGEAAAEPVEVGHGVRIVAGEGCALEAEAVDPVEGWVEEGMGFGALDGDEE